jgi:hypothetical protein
MKCPVFQVNDPFCSAFRSASGSLLPAQMLLSIEH